MSHQRQPSRLHLASDRGALLGPRGLRRIKLPVALLHAASPLVPGNRSADMVGASSLACNGDFRLRLPGTSICKEPAGSFQSALVGEDGGLIAGHARILAARQLGIAEIPVMVAAGWSGAPPCGQPACAGQSQRRTWLGRAPLHATVISGCVFPVPRSVRSPREVFNRCWWARMAACYQVVNTRENGRNAAEADERQQSLEPPILLRQFPTGAFLDERVKLAWDCVATDGAGKTPDQSPETPLPYPPYEYFPAREAASRLAAITVAYFARPSWRSLRPENAAHGRASQRPAAARGGGA